MEKCSDHERLGSGRTQGWRRASCPKRKSSHTRPTTCAFGPRAYTIRVLSQRCCRGEAGHCRKNSTFDNACRSHRSRFFRTKIVLLSSFSTPRQCDSLVFAIIAMLGPPRTAQRTSSSGGQTIETRQEMKHGVGDCERREVEVLWSTTGLIG